MSTSTKRAVVLLSGGLDSATVVAIAASQGYECYALSFDYGQRAVTELNAAKAVCESIGVKEHRVFNLDLAQFGGSALTDASLEVPEGETEGVPITYVPARNTIFLSMALAWAEVLHADAIFIGVNAVDYSGYPDCRPEFIAAYEQMANLATRNGVTGEPFKIVTPLIDLTKAEIIEAGHKLGMDYSLTVSCYQSDEEGRACGRCDSCRLRAKGFADSGVPDPTRYQN
ncbi:7-cyano-7-deazaguanine synthase QueC [Marinobacterium sp. LSUCC0821]|uniref:7-cyano-7-deazaguanine synthase QueC n=1 Tax=Marinobacterium sp. LSUCC0821 TaxID=2668067 RepID=UPI001451884C|nr:7-cyano-7-deazaguanine synthase QueC [Marinobacterium sp. LSUCC0821]QJD71215.1 7-cyano-7-deazaguanine synthase QueC [Marinobacterium sp. LSUCC0821]